MTYVPNPLTRVSAPRGTSRTGRQYRVTFWGDSIIRGQQDTGVDDANAGIRGLLHPMCNTRRDTRFTGSQTTGASGWGTHEGYSGTGITAMAAALSGLLAAATPDLAVWYLGTNEIGSGGTPAADAAAYNTGLVLPTLAFNSTIRMLVLPLFFFNSEPDIYDSERRAFNAALEPLVRANAAFGSRLFWGGSVASCLSDAADFYAAGNVHPSSAVGFPKFAAAVWYELTSQGLV